LGNLENTDFVMNNVFWVGTYPGLTQDMTDYIAESLGAATRITKRSLVSIPS
jgi:CDP-6-deoxy-D-xylo-4-hexulose-3-dehydrase